MKQNLALLAAVAIMALSGMASSSTVILYNNLSASSDGTDQIQTGLDTFSGPLYDSFSVGGLAVALTDLQLLLRASANTDGGSVSVGLYRDSSTAPGALITALGTILDSNLTSSLSAIDLPGLSVNLNAGTRYWIGLTSSLSSAEWSDSFNLSGTGVSGEYFALNQVGTGLHVLPNTLGPYQMKVTASTVPEAGTLALFGLGLAGLAGLRRRNPN